MASLAAVKSSGSFSGQDSHVFSFHSLCRVYQILKNDKSPFNLAPFSVTALCSRSFSLLIPGGLRGNCITGGSHPQQLAKPRPGAGGQATLAAAGPTGVRLSQVPGPV